MEKKFKSLSNFENLVGGKVDEESNKVSVNENNIQYIDIEKLKEVTDQPFKKYTDNALNELAEDIKENGLLAPLIVQPQGDGKYKILAGRNRYNACKLLNLKGVDVACIVKDVDDLKAELILLNSNLNQRHELLPSEKGFAYRRKLELNKKRHNVSKIYEVAEEVNESKTNIKNYIRLTYLTPKVLKNVDDGLLPIKQAVNISFLTNEIQDYLIFHINLYMKKLTIEQSETLKELNREKELSKDDIIKFFGVKEKSHNVTKPKKVNFTYEELEKYIGDIKKVDDLKQYILGAILFYEEGKEKSHNVTNEKLEEQIDILEEKE